ncbi:MAG: PQQ-binding-like beta-propeller repeat protein [Dehalococcoidales bacterium]
MKSLLRYGKGRLLAFIGLLLVVVVLLGGCTRTTLAGGGSAAVVDNGTLYIGSQHGELLVINAQGGRLWSVTLEQPAQSNFLGCSAAASPVAVYSTPVLDGDMVYVTGYDGRLRVYREGIEQGRYPAGETASVGGIVGGLQLAHGNIYFGTSKGEVIALDTGNLVAGTGDLVEKWQFDAGERVWSAPVVAGDTVYVTSMNGRLYALDADTGVEKWRFEDAEGAIVSSPVIYEGKVYFGSFDRYFYAVNADTGQLAWRSSLQAERWFWANPLVLDGTVYAGAMDGRVYVFNAANGESRAVVDLGAPLVSAPVLSGDSVIFATEKGDLWALDTAQYQASEFPASITGKVHASLSLSEGVIYIHTQDPDILYSVRADTGVNIWNVPLSSK